MRILILGASGLLGSSLSLFLIKNGYHVVRHGNKASCDVMCDMTDMAATQALLKEVAPDAIVNLVAQTNVDACESNVHGAYLLNVKTVENLVEAMRDRPDMYLVHISTDQVYDGYGLSNEGDVRLSNVYALTKYAGEVVAAKVPHTIFRTNFFGKSLLLGRLSFSDWLLNNLQKQVPITVFDDVVMNPVSIQTLCEAILLALSKRIAGTYNLGSIGALSKADFAFELARVFALDVANLRRGVSDDLKLLAYRPKIMSMDCSRFENAFNVRLPSLIDEIAKLKGSNGGS